MFGLVFVWFLSTILTQQAYGVQRFENSMLNAPAYQNQEQFYMHNPYDRVNDYTREIYSNDKTSYSVAGNNKASYSVEENGKDRYHVEENDANSRDSTEDDEGKRQGSRRLFEWFSRLFHSTTHGTLQTTVATTESSYQRELKERIFLRSLHRNLTELLFKLSEVQKQVHFVMTQKETYAILTRGAPQVLGVEKAFYYPNRVKRDTSNVVKEVSTKSSIIDKSVNNSIENVKVNDSECIGNATSGRRFVSDFVTPTEVKNKLLLYLQESFQEIKAKIMSLKNIKQVFSDNVSFKIGYILANIDTLEVSMMNLKNNMDKNKTLWEDKKILELYDTLKVSNQAVSGLIETLKVYLDKLSRQP